MSIEILLQELTPGLRPPWRELLLEPNLSQMTGMELARHLLREQKRGDVKVRLSQQDRNQYSPGLNWVGLSEAVANSPSVVAAAIAAHEVSHALQPEPAKSLFYTLKHNPIFSFMAVFGEIYVLLFKVGRMFRRHARQPGQFIADETLPAVQLNNSVQISFQSIVRQTVQVILENSQPLSLTILKEGLIVCLRILLLVSLTIVLLPLAAVVSLGYMVFILLCLVCAFLLRILIFLNELHISWKGLHLLQRYEILSSQQQQAVRKFLLACAFTYIRSPKKLPVS